MSEIDHIPCREEVLRAEIERLKAEIEQLRAARAEDQHRLFHYERLIDELRGRVEDLREELRYFGEVPL